VEIIYQGKHPAALQSLLNFSPLLSEYALWNSALGEIRLPNEPPKRVSRWRSF